MEPAKANSVTRSFPAALGEVIEIIIQNTDSDVGSVYFHPFYAYGAYYYDLGGRNDTYDPVTKEKNIRGLGLARRDTSMLYMLRRRYLDLIWDGGLGDYE